MSKNTFSFLTGMAAGAYLHSKLSAAQQARLEEEVKKALHHLLDYAPTAKEKAKSLQKHLQNEVQRFTASHTKKK